MKKNFSCSIFVRILLATLLPLTLIFSIVLITITKSTFQADTEAAQEKMFFFAQKSAEHIRNRLLGASHVLKLAAQGLAPIADDSDKAREAALDFVEHIFEDSPNVLRIRVYFAPGEDAFGKDGIFAYELHPENGVVVRHPLTLENESDLDLSLPQYAVPLKKGIPYHYSIAVHGGVGQDEFPTYIASTNYPVINNGKVIGCIGMELLYRKMFPLIDQWEADGGHLFFISEKGSILYAADTSLIGRKIDSLNFKPDFLEGMKTAMRQNTSFIKEGFSPVSEKESLICIYPMGLSSGLSQIFISISTPTEVVYRGAMASVRTMILTFLIGLLLFIGCLFGVTRNIVKPIKKLTESANLIANGQFEGALDAFDENRKTRDEVYGLGCSLQKMLKELLNYLKLKSIAMETEHEKIKLAETAAAKDRFFINMSHEIRTPMNVILSVSEILLAGNLTDDHKKLVQDIKVSSEGLLTIINDILDLSRLESGKLPLLPAHHDFRVLVENVCSICKYLAEEKGLDFRVETIGDMPEYLYCDDGRLRQVLLNIIGNAIKFTIEGSVTLIIADEGETLLFNIVDTGIGIQEEDLQYIFEPFRQIDGQEFHNAKGTGLGLSICLNLVDLMGGAITVDSEHGKGSSFHVRISKVIGDGDKVENKVESLSFSFAPGSRILVVDDSASNLRVAREFLKMFGITADTASSGMEAIAMAANSDYDLIFMDHMMSEMGGVETTHRIRALGDRQAKMPIIALTANAIIGNCELLLASGLNDFLAKPIEKVKFQAILAKWLPDNLVIRGKHKAVESDFVFTPAQMAEADGKTDGDGEKVSGVSESMHVLSRVSKLKGFNISLGLNRMAGNMELYVELLGMMVETVPETLEKIDLTLSDGDAASLSMAVHTLKSSLANLGAAELADKGAELEQIANQENFDLFMEKLEPFRKNLEAVIRNLREKLPGGKGEAQRVSAEKGEQSKKALRELRHALTRFDYGKSMKIVTDLSRFDWGEVDNLGIKTVRTHLRHFDYDAAMSELDRSFPEKENTM